MTVDGAHLPNAVPAMGFAMSGGEGEASYAKNSQSQAQVLGTCQAAIFDAVRSVPQISALASGLPALRIADLGCATGRNTVTAVSNLLDVLRQRYEEDSVAMPEVEVLFSDLPSNDFNTLFRHLPEVKAGDNWSLEEHSGTDSRAYYAGAVPGSFFNRLFPSRSMSVIMSFAALHWLSQVPAAILDKSSPAYNSNYIHLDGAKAAVQQVAAAQAASDLKAFLKHRAAELVSGGLLVLLFSGRVEPDPAAGDPGHPGLVQNGIVLLHSMQKLVAQGLLEAEKLDSFNIPLYCRSLEEVKSAILESQNFDIHLLKTYQVPVLGRQEADSLRENPKLFGKMFANKSGAVLRDMFVSHLGEETYQLLLEQVQELAGANHVQMISQMTLVANVAVLSRR